MIQTDHKTNTFIPTLYLAGPQQTEEGRDHCMHCKLKALKELRLTRQAFNSLIPDTSSSRTLPDCFLTLPQEI